VWRGGLLALALAGLIGTGARAQDTAQARLDIVLEPDSGGPGAVAPVVFARNLLNDSPWLAALRQGLPVRLRYRVEVWRSREAWLDALISQYEWTVVVRHEPLLDQFTVVTVRGRVRSTRRLATPGGLAEVLGLGYRLLHTRPAEAGTYYYVASLTVSTLSETDLDELQRFFRGELQSEDDTTPHGSSLGRTLRRGVLKLAGLPSLNLTARSGPFQVP
jgi:Domain of unknown function (DUF4390)